MLPPKNVCPASHWLTSSSSIRRVSQALVWNFYDFLLHCSPRCCSCSLRTELCWPATRWWWSSPEEETERHEAEMKYMRGAPGSFLEHDCSAALSSGEGRTREPEDCWAGRMKKFARQNLETRIYWTNVTNKNAPQSDQSQSMHCVGLESTTVSLSLYRFSSSFSSPSHIIKAITRKNTQASGANWGWRWRASERANKDSRNRESWNIFIIGQVNSKIK